jgi:hypothetical protein
MSRELLGGRGFISTSTIRGLDGKVELNNASVGFLLLHHQKESG